MFGPSWSPRCGSSAAATPSSAERRCAGPPAGREPPIGGPRMGQIPAPSRNLEGDKPSTRSNGSTQEVMSIEVDTKDCTALSDAELADMADICTDGSAGFDVGFLSKQRDEWVLVTQAREGGRLAGFSFFTLERVVGTPSLLVGLAPVEATFQLEHGVWGQVNEQYSRVM